MPRRRGNAIVAMSVRACHRHAQAGRMERGRRSKDRSATGYRRRVSIIVPVCASRGLYFQSAEAPNPMTRPDDNKPFKTCAPLLPGGRGSECCAAWLRPSSLRHGAAIAFVIGIELRFGSRVREDDYQACRRATEQAHAFRRKGVAGSGSTDATVDLACIRKIQETTADRYALMAHSTNRSQQDHLPNEGYRCDN